MSSHSSLEPTSLHWQPTADFGVIRQRALMLRYLREFFRQRDVLEVETPIMSQGATCDPFIDSFSTVFNQSQLYLQTSPELAMKRLLAAGSGAIYQVARVFRDGESGPKHNPEFSMLEWYRPGYRLEQLMTEVEELVRGIFEGIKPSVNAQAKSGSPPVKKMSYQQCFEQLYSINPHTASIDELYLIAKQAELHEVLERTDSKDQWLDLIMSHLIEPKLGGTSEQPEICFVYDYPATQAALARVEHNRDGIRVAKRFEVYIASMELANGFYELLDADEQRRRFEADNRRRQELGKSQVPIDQHFLQALDSGLPECSGVALGLDRLLMLVCGQCRIDEVLSFSIDHA